MIKKADIILFILILAAGLIVSFLPLAGTLDRPQVKVTVAGDTYGIYDLNKDQTVEITQETEAGAITNLLIIENGQCRMEQASCHNQICVNHSPIDSRGEVIVCLPNRVVVEIVGDSGKGGDVDVISG